MSNDKLDYVVTLNPLLNDYFDNIKRLVGLSKKATFIFLCAYGIKNGIKHNIPEINNSKLKLNQFRSGQEIILNPTIDILISKYAMEKKKHNSISVIYEENDLYKSYINELTIIANSTGFYLIEGQFKRFKDLTISNENEFVFEFLKLINDFVSDDLF